MSDGVRAWSASPRCPTALVVAMALVAIGCGERSRPSGQGGNPVAERICDAQRSAPKGTAFALGEVVPDVALPTLVYPPPQPGSVMDLAGTLTNELRPSRPADYFVPCGSAPSLLVYRVGAPWCGLCGWHQDHTDELIGPLVASGQDVSIVDVLVGNEDNDAPDVASARAWQDRARRPVVLDASFTMAPVSSGPAPLPLYVLVDRATLRVDGYLNDPTPEQLRSRVREWFAEARGEPRPRTEETARVDGRFSTAQWELLRGMRHRDAPPPDPTNRVADDARARELGRALFSDGRLSPTGLVSCASCHVPSIAFSDGSPQALGVARGARNAPSILLAAHARWQFWDGRADTLWAQALGPMENPIEMGSSRLFVAHHIFAEYKVGYEAVFGALPPLTDGARFPPAGKPGEPAFDGMAEADREAVTTVFVNAAKSIAAFERGLRARPSRFDAYLDGDERALTAEEKDGIVAFFQAGCSQCHHGPRLTDDGFHSLRFPSHSLAADEGRLGAFGVMKRSPFRADGPYSDAPRGDRRVARARPGRWGRGAFKTPSLRGTAATGPWGHAGTLPSLDDVLRVYGRRGMPMDRALDGGPDSGLGSEPLPDGLAVGETEPWVPEFDDAARGPIEAFLRTLTADPADDRESLRGPPQR